MQEDSMLDRLLSVAFVTVCLFLISTLSFLSAQEYRSMDGVGNNLAAPEMGSSNTALIRFLASDYADSVSQPAGQTRQSARVISNVICNQAGVSMPNSADASDYLWQWGQFLDHDIDLTEGDRSDPFPVEVPIGDPQFDPTSTGTATILLSRSQHIAGSSSREQKNGISAWIDASNVYGSDATRASVLRTNDGTGKLKTSAGNLLPLNTDGLPNASPPGLPPEMFFLAGDIRANEQVGLTAMHTLFVREHNRLAEAIALEDPNLTGEEVYLRARQIVGAQMQKVTYSEFLPLLLGPSAIPPYSGYDANVNAGIMNCFSTAAYRFGHSLLSATLLRIGIDGVESPEGHLPLASAFFSPSAIIEDGGIEPILRGLAVQRSQEVDPLVNDAVRNFLFGPPGAGGFDLASLNIQRGRDHGLPSYNDARTGLGLPARTSFAEITSDIGRQQALAAAYGDVDDIDLWVGGLSEDHASPALVGETFYTIIRSQFLALRNGDRFWYQVDLDAATLAEVESTTLADIIRRNTAAMDIQDDVFRVSTPDFVRSDCNNDGMTDIGDGIFLLDFLFSNGGLLQCANACDFGADGLIDVADAIAILSYSFVPGSPSPPAPWPNCGSTSQAPDEVPCFAFSACP